MMETTPGTAMATNQMSMIGPKNAATRAVPHDWAANSNNKMMTVAGTT